MRSPALAFCSLALLALIAAPLGARAGDPPLPDGTAAARRALDGFRLPAGLRAELFAAEPQLASPVAICVDEQGRVFVAEEFRFNRGTEENRTRPFLLEDDLQVNTLSDRLAMFRKYADRFDGGMEWFQRHADQIRVLADRDGDGAADQSQVFAGDFNGTLDGLAAGVLAREGEIYFTCIPHLWRLSDRDGDGIADERQALLRGFGVNAGFLGHDLHGLTWGPDGKLYFSVGDRGLHVTTREGETISNPRNGAVMRCLPDGSEFEVLHRGLRNPQEIAFDQYGNLFAADNNCDKGDHSRLVYILEGGDSGWNMAFQSIPEPYLTGPWHAERLWHLAHDGQPAWIVPPVGKLGAGPSGFAYYPGTGLPDRYREHFFLCNFTGDGGIEAFALQPRGAGFDIVDEHDFLKPIFATDLEFGYDGKVYVSDFVGLDWNGPSKGGRIYTVADPNLLASSLVRGVAERFRAGFAGLRSPELGELLQHPDLRVRQRAQFELARRVGPLEATDDLRAAARDPREYSAADLQAGRTRLTRSPPRKSNALAFETLVKATSPARPLLTRLHGLWGLGIAARTTPRAFHALLPLLHDADDEVRAQVARVMGDHRHASAADQVLPLLSASSPRVKLFAALALGRMRVRSAVEPLLAVAKSNVPVDPQLRHATVAALESIGDREGVVARAQDPDAAVRMVVLLVLRRWRDPRIAQYLTDSEPLLVTEAARAINDLPLDELTGSLAALHTRYSAGLIPEAEPLYRRIIHANFRLGGPDEAIVVARFASREELPLPVRREALMALADWERPAPRDRVTGFWRPLPERPVEPVRQALEPLVPELLAGTVPELQPLAVAVVTRLGLSADAETVRKLTLDAEAPVATRSAALRLLATLTVPEFPEILAQLLADPAPAVRATARELLARHDAAAGVRELTAALDSESADLLERQQALAALATLQTPAADEVLVRWTERLRAAEAPSTLQLDIHEAATARGTPALQQLVAAIQVVQTAAQAGDPLARFRWALDGGDPERGRALFVGHAVGQCIRCHRVAGTGGTAGPDLSGVATRNHALGREYLLESLVNPGARIVPGFGTTAIVLGTGKIVSGILQSETPDQVVIALPSGETVAIAMSDIEERTPPQSPMPTVARALTLRELRDLVAYLATLTQPAPSQASP